MSLLRRLEETLDRLEITQREWARRAKLTDERHLGVIMSRLRKNPRADIERETLTALAKGAGISLRWLATGEGSPEDHDATDAPTLQHTDDATPTAENIPGYLQVEAEDRKDPANADLEERWWLQGRKAAAFWIHGGAQKGDAAYLARMARRFGSEERLKAMLVERERRLKELEGEVARLKKLEDEAIAKKAARKAGKAPRQ